MKFSTGTLIVLLLLGGCASMQTSHKDHASVRGSRYAPMVHWNSLAEGRLTAMETQKPMLVDFAVPEHCSRCAFLQNNVYNRETIVAKINRDFVPIWIDLTGDLTVEEATLGEKFDYANDCLLLFLNHEGQVIKDPRGSQMCFADQIEPEVFMEHLDHVRKQYVPES